MNRVVVILVIFAVSEGRSSVVMTMTTCKRPRLFRETMTTFFQCCDDAYDVLRALVIIDDHSSEKDAREMEKFATLALAESAVKLVWLSQKRDQNVKGHARALNRLRDYILAEYADVEYIFHCEDDWRFFRPISLRSMVRIMNRAESHIGQLLVNQDYGEAVDNYHPDGVIVGSRPSDDEQYYVHVYDPGRVLCTKEKHISNGHWPHYSLRPGLTRTRVWKHVGRYNEQTRQFEAEYGMRYFKQCGYVTAFLPGISALHIGPKSWERNSTKSSYYLNKTER